MFEASASSIERNWPSIGRLTGVRTLARDGHGEWGGRARTLLVRGTKGSVRVTGAAFRSALGLRSDWFRVRSLGRPSAADSARYRFTFDMGIGTRHVAVTHLQRRLRAGRFYPPDTPVTGYFGTITRDSLERYQRAHGIEPTGYLGQKTRTALNREAARPVAAKSKKPRYRFTFDMGVGTRHKAVVHLKRRLRSEGFYPRTVRITRYFGSTTREAVRRYQRAHDIRQTGYLGPITRRALNRAR
jgi:peptidoglycan hydrolase-like protein with peptidoglycan-binding domain